MRVGQTQLTGAPRRDALCIARAYMGAVHALLDSWQATTSLARALESAYRFGATGLSVIMSEIDRDA